MVARMAAQAAEKKVVWTDAKMASSKVELLVAWKALMRVLRWAATKEN
jgi:hypothetical protein